MKKKILENLQVWAGLLMLTSMLWFFILIALCNFIKPVLGGDACIVAISVDVLVGLVSYAFIYFTTRETK